MPEVVTVWPCGHGNVELERVAVPLGVTCNVCGAHPEHYVPKAEAERLRDALREIIEASEHHSLTVRSMSYMAAIAHKALERE